MGLSWFPLWVAMTMVFLVGIAIWWLVVAGIFWFRNKDFVYSRGANGSSGDQTTLVCPIGTTIKLEPIHLQCADVDSFGKQPFCDPFNNDGTVNKTNTEEITSALESLCSGQNTCTFTIPNAKNICPNCQQFQMVGTFACE